MQQPSYGFRAEEGTSRGIEMKLTKCSSDLKEKIQSVKFLLPVLGYFLLVVRAYGVTELSLWC